MTSETATSASTLQSAPSQSPTSSTQNPLTLPIHRGAIDRTTITTAPPTQVMDTMRTLLINVGVRVRDESAFRIRCVRPGAGASEAGDEEEEGNRDGGEGRLDNDADDSDDEQKAEKEEEEDLEHSSSDSDSGSGSGSDTETEASRAPVGGKPPRASKARPKKRVQQQVRRIPQLRDAPAPALRPRPDPPPNSNSNSSDNFNSETSRLEIESRTLRPKQSQTLRKCTLYGPSPSSDPSQEVRFSVELTQLAGLPGTYSLDIRRLKGHLRSYKFIYDTLRDHAAKLNGPSPSPSSNSSSSPSASAE